MVVGWLDGVESSEGCARLGRSGAWVFLTQTLGEVLLPGCQGRGTQHWVDFGLAMLSLAAITELWVHSEAIWLARLSLSHLSLMRPVGDLVVRHSSPLGSIGQRWPGRAISAGAYPVVAAGWSGLPAAAVFAGLLHSIVCSS